MYARLIFIPTHKPFTSKSLSVIKRGGWNVAVKVKVTHTHTHIHLSCYSGEGSIVLCPEDLEQVTSRGHSKLYLSQLRAGL